MGSRILAAFAAIFLLFPAVAFAQERSALKQGFAFPKHEQVTIAVFRPDVHVGSLTAGGVDEPNADWTGEARKLIGEALQRNGTMDTAKFSFPEEPVGDDGAYLAEYRSLFRAVAQAIMIHKLFPGNRLPTKKETFDWTLGNGAQRLRELSGSDYALFLFTHDSYGTSGRKTAQILGAMLGAYVPAGIHIGYAGLVDLRTGDVVWFNADPQMGGDVRTVEGADKRVGQLLAGLPGTVAPAAPSAAAGK